MKEGEGEECTCLCCGTIFHGNYCPQCGQASNTGRLVLRDIASNIFNNITNMDGRLLHTVTDLFTRPGHMIWDYLQGRRAEYFKPVQMLFFLATIMLFIKFIFGIDADDSIIDLEPDDGDKISNEVLIRLKNMIEWIRSNKAFYTLFVVFLFVLPNKLAFRKTERGRNLNLTEHFFFMAFAECQLLIVTLPCLVFKPIYDLESTNLFFFLQIGLYLWIVHQFYQLSWWKSIRCIIRSYILMGIEVVLFAILAIIAIVTFIAIFNPEMLKSVKT